MKLGKQHVARIFLLCQSLLFGWFYLFGNHGITSINVLKKEINGLQLHTCQLQKENDTLHHTLAMQNQHSFFKEKIAREQLQMARTQEEIYFID